MRTLIVAVVTLAGLGVRADEPKVKAVPTAEPTAAQTALADTIRAGQKGLRDLKAYTVAAESKWTHTAGKKELTGTTTLTARVEGITKLRIDLGAAGEADPHLVVSADGTAITRWFSAAKLYSVTPYTGTPLDDIQIDGVTTTALRLADIDFLVRPDVLGVLFAQTLSVEDLGPGDDTARPLRGFRLKLANDKTVTVRFTAGDTPLPVEIRSDLDIHVGDKQKHTRTATTTLKWDLTAKPDAAAFAVTVPADATKVDDLMDAVLDTGVNELLGRPAPAAEFVGLDDKPVKVADSAGKSVVVLYAWATWAAPSVADMPGLNRFVDEYTKKGVAFVAVNVGETTAAVREFVRAAKYTGVVALDPKGEGLADLRLQRVPGVVVIGKDGTVQSYHRGGTDTAARVKADLDRLLTGETLAPKK
jgi:thiol-disulfide isomerase/thioredoxin